MSSSQGLKHGVALKGNTYKIERVLGHGTFGITYLATAKFITTGSLGQMAVEAKVAVKEFFMDKVNSRGIDGSSVEGSSAGVCASYRKKFRKEAENLAKLSHPNIVKVFDVFDENSTTYYVMEFIEGQDLDAYIKQQGGLTEEQAVSITKKVGMALAYMHSRNMLHLDVKPKNIMRKTDGEYYLIDFGLSKQYTEAGEPESSTTIGLGTPGYAPIEQAGYKQDGTFPAVLDVYALGATMFKMLTGKTPPESTYILNEGFPMADLAARGVSRETCAVVKKAMSPIKKDRYQQVKAFINDLKGQGTDVDDVTVVGTVQNPEPPQDWPQSDPRQEPDSEPVHGGSSKSLRILLWIVGSIVALFVIFAVIGSYSDDSGGYNTFDESLADTLAYDVDTVPYAVDMYWDSPLGKAVYTGEVGPDSIEGSDKWLPNGKGVATILEGQYAGSIYDGEFNWGVMEGETKYTLKNGDTFVGTFRHNQYWEGRYTRSSGEYFSGRFKKEQPSSGTWYDKNGNELYVVK